jgi:hypothetical protein
MNKRTGLALLVVFSAAAGCGDNDLAPGPAPAELEVAGSYELVSTYDFTVAGALPDPVATYAQTLTGLSSDPAGTLFNLLDEAGVPIASDLLAALPSPVANELKSWINDAITNQRYGNASAKSELDTLATALQTVVARPDVVSTLQVDPPGADGAIVATHALEELRYTLYGGTTEISVPIRDGAAPGPLLTLRTTADGRVTAPLSNEDAHIQIGDHAFGVAYGDYALAALDQALRARFATDLRGALGQLVDCAGMAHAVASRCVLGACVGHQDTLAAICDDGLDLVDQDIRDRVAALRIDALRLTSGQAQMWDAPAGSAALDRTVDRLSTGKWAAQVDFGMGARDVHGTFAGTRIAKW